MKHMIITADRRYFQIEEIAEKLGEEAFWQPTHPEEDQCIPFVYDPIHTSLPIGEIREVEDDSGVVKSYRATICQRCDLGVDGVCLPSED